MQAQSTRKQDTAELANGGGVVETQRPTAAGRITHRTPLTTWIDALVKTSEAQRAHLRTALGQGVGR